MQNNIRAKLIINNGKANTMHKKQRKYVKLYKVRIK